MARGQPELGRVSAGLLPQAGSTGVELETHPDVGQGTAGPREIEIRVEFERFLDHDDDTAAELSWTETLDALTGSDTRTFISAIDLGADDDLWVATTTPADFACGGEIASASDSEVLVVRLAR